MIGEEIIVHLNFETDSILVIEQNRV